MHKITSREYKVMLEHRWFKDRQAALNAFWDEVSSIAQASDVKTRGSFNTAAGRSITFFDTSDLAMRENGLVFRRRVEQDDHLQFTLKARNSDRYIANGFALKVDKHFDSKTKFEEDIAAPFRSRFSHSTTAEFKQKSDSPFGKTPNTLKQARRLFNEFAELKRGDEMIDVVTKLIPVNDITAQERVYTGPELELKGGVTASVAVILWTHGWDGRPLVAEFSFRYKNKDEKFKATTAGSARRFFERLQRLDWCKPDGPTKTAWVYGDS